MPQLRAHPVKGVLAVRRLSLQTVAADIGCAPTHLSLVLNGYRPLTPSMAERLSAYLRVKVKPTPPVPNPRRVRPLPGTAGRAGAA